MARVQTGIPNSRAWPTCRAWVSAVSVTSSSARQPATGWLWTHPPYVCCGTITRSPLVWCTCATPSIRDWAGRSGMLCALLCIYLWAISGAGVLLHTLLSASRTRHFALLQPTISDVNSDPSSQAAQPFLTRGVTADPPHRDRHREGQADRGGGWCWRDTDSAVLQAEGAPPPHAGGQAEERVPKPHLEQFVKSDQPPGRRVCTIG